MSVPLAPGRVPLLGHTLSMPRRWQEFTTRLVHELLITKGSSFKRGALFDKLLPFFGSGLATSNGAFHRRRMAGYGENMAHAAAGLTARTRVGGRSS
ncbi:MAG: hypothetical protein WBA97_35905 [Actinophytocola sp.]|uniref:hypothetical protein n=1 Tax=Actinophytocola sp. TaxID=1872138 RepID=UPI003C73E18B